jgi:DNA modification methylase
MPFIDCSTVEVRTRQRSADPSLVGQLRDSLRTKGLLHPPVVARDESGHFLIAGFHRKQAIESLHKDGVQFFFDGLPVPPGQMPIVNLLDLSPADLLETELEENIIRRELSWQDRIRALAAIHQLRVAENPLHTFRATSEELSVKGAPVGPDRLRHDLRNATILAQHMHRPSIAKARNATEAFHILAKEEEARFEAELIGRKQKSTAASAAKLIEVRHGDFTAILPSLDAGLFDLIIADLPYGINADKGGFRKRTVEHHNYEDSPETALALLRAILTDGFRVTKTRANLFIFGDIDLFAQFKTLAGAMGWTTFRTPIIWRKSETEGLAPWGREGFRRTYELIFFATKGKKGLHQSPVDILDEKRVGRAVRRYGPEKPVGLIQQLIECATMPGDYILDPCCGAGSTLIAARHSGRKALGIELDESAYNLSVVAAERDPIEPDPTAAEPQAAEELA